MGKKSRDKGKRGEREARDYLGGDAVRTWWHPHDIQGSDGRYYEVKRTKLGFAACYQALEEYLEHNQESGENQPAIVLARQDRKPWIVIMYADDYFKGSNEDHSSIPSQGQRDRRTPPPTVGSAQP